MHRYAQPGALVFGFLLLQAGQHGAAAAAFGASIVAGLLEEARCPAR